MTLPTRTTQADFELLSTQEGYDRWSTVYDTDGNPLIALEEPLVDQLLGDIAGKEVIDLGCGTGRHAIRMANAGALVDAVDFSENMLSRARTKSAELQIRYQALNLLSRLPFPDRSFDRVICGLVLDHIPALENFFGEMHRLCRPGGRCVLSVMHPAMMLRGVQARFWDPQTGREVRPASQPHQISDYVMQAGAALWRERASIICPDAFTIESGTGEQVSTGPTLRRQWHDRQLLMALVPPRHSQLVPA